MGLGQASVRQPGGAGPPPSAGPRARRRGHPAEIGERDPPGQGALPGPRGSHQAATPAGKWAGQGRLLFVHVLHRPARLIEYLQDRIAREWTFGLNFL